MAFNTTHRVRKNEAQRKQQFLRNNLMLHCKIFLLYSQDMSTLWKSFNPIKGIQTLYMSFTVFCSCSLLVWLHCVFYSVTQRVNRHRNGNSWKNTKYSVSPVVRQQYRTGQEMYPPTPATNGFSSAPCSAITIELPLYTTANIWQRRISLSNWQKKRNLLQRSVKSLNCRQHYTLDICLIMTNRKYYPFASVSGITAMLLISIAQYWCTEANIFASLSRVGLFWMKYLLTMKTMSPRKLPKKHQQK